MPKQLARIAGKPIIEHTIAAVDASSAIDEIIVMMEPNHMAAVEDLIAAGRYPEFWGVFPGGETRNDTTRLALAQLGDDECKVSSTTPATVRRRPVPETASTPSTTTARWTPPSPPPTRSSRSTPRPTCWWTSRRVPSFDAGRRRRRSCGRPSRPPTARARTATSIATDDGTVVLKYTPDVPIAVIAGSTRT